MWRQRGQGPPKAGLTHAPAGALRGPICFEFPPTWAWGGGPAGPRMPVPVTAMLQKGTKRHGQQAWARDSGDLRDPGLVGRTAPSL